MAQARGIVPGLKPINSGGFYAGVKTPASLRKTKKFVVSKKKFAVTREVAGRIPDCNEQAGQAN
jgi:hypothetical protein